MVLEYDRVFVIVSATILTVQFLLGLFFNIVVLAASQRVLLTNQDHGQGNHFIRNLNIVDIILCLTAIPITLAALFKSQFSYTLFCYFLEGVINFVSVASLMTLFMVSLDRYFAISTPTKERIITTKLNYFLILIWTFAALSFCAPFFALNRDLLFNDSSHFSCNHIIDHNSPYYFYELFYVVTFVITTVGMILFYVAISRSAAKRASVTAAVTTTVSGTFSGRRITYDIQRERDQKRIRVSIGIVITFALLWGPHVVVSIIEMVVTDSVQISMAKISCLLLAYMTTIVHPLMYAVMRRKIREEIIKKWRRKVAPMPHSMEIGI